MGIFLAIKSAKSRRKNATPSQSTWTVRVLLRLKKASASQHQTNHPPHPATCSVKAEHAGGKCHLVTLSRSLTALHTVRTGTRCSLPRHPHRLHKQTGASQSLSTQGYPRIWDTSWGFFSFIHQFAGRKVLLMPIF